MRKLIIIIILMMMPVCYSETSVTVPEFDVMINGVVIDKESSTYPIFTYKSITYIPLTSDYIDGFGLQLEFTPVNGLNIWKSTVKDFEPSFLEGNFRIGQSVSVREVPFQVTMNDKQIESTYPVLFYEDIVYMPLTWEVAHDILGFDYYYDGNLYIGQRKEILDVERMRVSVGENIKEVGFTFSLDSKNDLNLYIDNHIVPLEYEYVEALDKYVYKCTVVNLESEQLYKFRIGNEMVISKYFDFTSLPNDVIELTYFGDIQGYNLSQYETFREVYDDAGEIDLAYIAGDIVDKGNSLSHWNYFDQMMATTHQDVMVTAIGNHDAYGKSKIYENTFNYPENGLYSERNFYFDLPYARVAVVDTESSHSDQKAWLKETMDVNKFKIVLMHRSVYPIKYDGSYVRSFADTFDELNIDLVLSGHDHIYSRTQMKDNQKDAAGVVYIVGGSGSGSKYYNQSTERYWQDVIYDNNNPVFIKLKLSEDKIDIESYAVESEIRLIDSTTIEKSE